MTLIEQALARIAEMGQQAHYADCGGSVVVSDLLRTDLPALCALVRAFIGQVPFDEALRKEELAALKMFTEAK